MIFPVPAKSSVLTPESCNTTPINQSHNTKLIKCWHVPITSNKPIGTVSNYRISFTGHVPGRWSVAIIKFASGAERFSLDLWFGPEILGDLLFTKNSFSVSVVGRTMRSSEFQCRGNRPGECFSKQKTEHANSADGQWRARDLLHLR